MVARCLNAGQVKQVIGIAVDARRRDVLLEALTRPLACYFAAELIGYMSNVEEVRYVLEAVVEVCMNNNSMNQTKNNIDWVFLADCLVALGDKEKLNYLLDHLKQHDDALFTQIAYNHALEVKPFPSIKQLHLHFLSSCNASDMLILEQTRASISPTASMHHSALSATNAIMHVGTTCDMFLRKNMEWLSHANNWSKFVAVSGMGLIHRGRIGDGEKILEAYLPNEDSLQHSRAEYSEGGALYALGLIGDPQALQHLINIIEKTEIEVLLHGALLGLGSLALSESIGLVNEDLINHIKSVLYRDETIAGEAAGLALGLLKKGSMDTALIQDMLAYAHDTEHEKIIRSLAIGVAVIVAGQGDDALSIALEMLQDKDVLIRYGGAWALSLAYAATSSNTAIRHLLHTAVSDASDDVRRAAVTGLGLVLLRAPRELLSILELLIESFNPHVRYGSTMALGIVFAGTADKQCIEMLHPLIKDPIDMVRQGALISLSLVFCNNHDSTANEGIFNSTSFRSHLVTIISSRYEAPLTKFGAILSQGILDCGGRNARPLFLTPSLDPITKLQFNHLHGSLLSILVLVSFDALFWIDIESVCIDGC